ncbi:MAG: MerR family transcriptional regulator [Gammaproteobacteria bacterium]|jgi:DNA-binding transcriptional MerR regulator|nr:MerR family transcriptional regulator [Gammaproteobacteria bacterium]
MDISTFPIRILAERTGVPPSTIRAWERRYGILQAQRTACGHRHYTDQDVTLIQRLQQRLARGATISKAIRELDTWQEDENRHQQQLQINQDQQWQHLVMELLQAISRFDDQQLDRTYQQALSLYTVDIVTDKILRPTLLALGERWPSGATSIAEEHFFSTYLRNKIGARLHHSPPSTGPILVIACVPGEHHELGGLLFALSAQHAGYRVLLLGANLPCDQILPVVDKVQAAGVVLSVATRLVDPELEQQLDCLAAATGIPIMLGGVAIGEMESTSIHLLGCDFTGAMQRLVSLVPLH